MKRFALIIGIEDFSAKKHFTRVDYASFDAQELSGLLQLAKFEIVKTLIQTDASFENVNNALAELYGKLSAEDEFWFYYAGHGRANGAGHTVLACQDSPFTHEIENGLHLRSVLAPFLDGNGPRVVLLIDACNSALKPDLPPVYSQSELADTAKSPHILCLTACQPNESAYPNNERKHGVWTYHVLQCLRGLVPQSLAHGRFLDPYHMHGYLRNVVPAETLSLHNTQQNPGFYGTFSGPSQLLDVANLFRPRISKGYVHFRICEPIANPEEKAAKFDVARIKAFKLLDEMRAMLECTIEWDEKTADSRQIRWMKSMAAIDIDVSWHYPAEDFVASDIIVTTDSWQCLEVLLEQELHPYFCIRYWLVPDANIEETFARLPTELNIVHSSRGPIRISVDKDGESVRVEMHTTNLEPAHPGMLRAHSSLPLCVLNGLIKGLINRIDIEKITASCFAINE